MNGYLDFFVDGSGFFLFLLQQSFGLIQLGLRDGVLFLQLCDLLLAFDCSFLELKLFFIKIKTLQITETLHSCGTNYDLSNSSNCTLRFQEISDTRAY